eukprot:Em0289g2a
MDGVRIGILYDPSVLEYVDSYRTFLNAMKNYTVEFAFTSYVSRTYFPLAGLKATYVRVIVSFLGRELQEKVLCLAYHMNMTYPRYQWILVDPTSANDQLGNVSIVYTNTEYTCDQDLMASALNRSVFAVIDKFQPLDTITSVPGINNYDPFENCTDDIGEYGAFAFVSTDFDSIHRTTSIPLATVVVAIGVVVPLVVLVGIHVLNTVYWNVPSIKASSSNLNHFAYVGCYFILFAEVVYTSGELASFNIGGENGLMQRVSMVLDIGTDSGVIHTWTWSHPLVRQATNHTISSGETFVILLEDYCDTENQAYWFAAAIIFEATLLASCVVLAFLNRNVIMKDFQTHSVILLAYLLTLTGIVGAATYFITSSIGALNISLSYGIQCLVLSLTVYLCIFLLFLPPVWPVLKGYQR